MPVPSLFSPLLGWCLGPVLSREGAGECPMHRRVLSNPSVLGACHPRPQFPKRLQILPDIAVTHPWLRSHCFKGVGQSPVSVSPLRPQPVEPGRRGLWDRCPRPPELTLPPPPHFLACPSRRGGLCGCHLPVLESLGPELSRGAVPRGGQGQESCPFLSGCGARTSEASVVVQEQQALVTSPVPAPAGLPVSSGSKPPHPSPRPTGCL